MNSRARSRRWLAAALGAAIGLALLLFLLPSTGADVPAKRPQARVARVERRSPPKPAVAVQPDTPRKPPPTSPSDPVAPPVAPASELAYFIADVVDEDGRPVDRASVIPVDCRGFGHEGRPGTFVAEPGRCALRAVRRDGALMAHSDTVDVVLAASTADEPHYVQLQLSRARTGGIGVRFDAQGDGVRVLTVSEGSPAWEAGIEPGDLIISVDGEPVDGHIDAQGFVDRMTGPEGTDVQFELRLPDGTVDVLRVTRRYLDG